MDEIDFGSPRFLPPLVHDDLSQLLFRSTCVRPHPVYWFFLSRCVQFGHSIGAFSSVTASVFWICSGVVQITSATANCPDRCVVIFRFKPDRSVFHCMPVFLRVCAV